MAKPSIFSRDYEKKMRKRKRRIYLSIFLVVFITIGVFLKIQLKNIDFSEIKVKIQAWVDSDKPENVDNEEISKEEEKDPIEEEEEPIEEKEEEESYMNLDLGNGLYIKVNYVEENGQKKFNSVDEGSLIDGISYDISPLLDKIIIKDTNQNLLLFNINGEKKDVTKESYTSQAGTVFLKSDILASNSNYQWHKDVKFIDEENIAYVSRLPYFGDAAINDYLWTYNIINGSETCLWNNFGPEISLGSIVPDKGLSFVINGGTYYINGAGSIVQ